MLSLNLSHLTNEEIEDVIRLYCARFGSVNSVVIGEDHPNSAFAKVIMALEDDSEKVADTFGGYRLGKMVIIRLEQEKQVIPNSLRLS